MITQRFFGARRGIVAVLVAGLVLVALGVAFVSERYADARREGSRPASPPQLHLLASAAEHGNDVALRELIDAFDNVSVTQAQPIVFAMLRSDRPEVRAAATAWIGRRGAPEMGSLIVPRMSDADWRVRAAAFNAMRRVAGDVPGAPSPSSTPLRDTPVGEREDVIFAWIDAWRNGGETLPKLPALCDLYAPANHWLTGTALVESCLACHAPRDAYTTADSQSCAACHTRAHDSWARSAHAQTTSHMNLARVDERTKKVVAYDFGERKGLLCTTCHVPATDDDEPSSTAPPPGTERLRVPHHFRANAGATCVACHEQTQREWGTWKVNPRPARSRWLPGEVTWDDQPDARTCVSCHMTPQRASGGPAGLDHQFGARRDVDLMRSGLAVRIEPPTAGRDAQLVLTNLAGHAYPSGGIRRALRVEVVYDDDEATRRVLARLTSSSLPTTQPLGAALQPAEERRIDLMRPQGASRVTCEVVYERNQFEAGAYELPLHRASESLVPPPSG
ncbi:MAG: multiheme c-type cytochrome [Tepidisphaeraceae bacterium]